jgi:hypothetical protein
MCWHDSQRATRLYTRNFFPQGEQMKKNKIVIYFFLLLTLVFLIPKVIFAENWEYHGTTVLGDHFYSRETVISPNKNIFRVWQKTVYSEEGRKKIKEMYDGIFLKAIDAALNLDEKQKEIKKKDIKNWPGPKYSLNFEEFDCKNGTYRDLFFTYYKDDGEKWSDFGTNTLSDPPFSPCLPGTAIEALWKKICLGEQN